jgi:hypothetical protein
VRVNFVTQPFAEEGSLLHDFLAHATGGPSVRLDVVVAWAKRSGLSRVQPALERLRSEGASLRLLVGIDEGGATRQGLEMALALFDEVFIFHDPSGRTFHPKVYAAVGEHGAEIFVGSNNLTAGGVYFNYEAAIQLNLTRPADDDLIGGIAAYVGRLLADHSICLQLTPELLQQLVTGSYRIGDEDQTRSSKPGAAAEKEYAGTGERLFGRSFHPKRGDPGSAATRRARQAAAVAPALEAGAVAPGPVGGVVVKRWFKELKRSDAQQTVTGSNPTGNLRLVRAGLDLDQTTYFRQVLFGGEDWAVTPKQRGRFEETVVPFEVSFAGQNLAVVQHFGVVPLRIDDAQWREAGQGNHTAVLHWGPLTTHLTATDFVGGFVVIELLDDGSYRLRITPERLSPDDFLP